jgi:hypothetical protein
VKARTIEMQLCLMISGLNSLGANNMKARQAFALFTLLALLLSGCQQEQPEEKPQETKVHTEAVEAPSSQPEPIEAESVSPLLLLAEPVDLKRFESISDAMPVWRKFADQKPTLLLLSDKPQLIPPPEILREPIDHLMQTGSTEAIRLASDYQNPEALLKAPMTVDIALRNKWFKELIWVFPSRDPGLDPNLELLQSEFIKHSIIDNTEAASLSLQDKVIHGTIRNQGFAAAALPWTPEQKAPVIIHIDLSYFQSLYKNEIATPVLQTIYSTLQQLKEKQLTTLAVTFSYSHMDNRIALDVRFLGEVLSTLFTHPEMLSKEAPPNWQRQANAIYLANFFQKEKIEEIFKAQQNDDPESAWVNFNLYRSSAEMKEGNTALEYLAKAVSLDQVYALEYANLSRMAYDKKRPDEALRMLSLAMKGFPDDPFLKLRLAQLATELGDTKTSRHLVEQLQGLSWSEIYYPNMPALLEEMLTSIEKNTEISAEE